MRVVLISLLTADALASACPWEGDRVYAEAKRCAESIARRRLPGATGLRLGEVQATSAAPSETPNGMRAGAASQEAIVDINVSESMRGFVSAPDSNFVKVIEAIGYAMPFCGRRHLGPIWIISRLLRAFGARPL